MDYKQTLLEECCNATGISIQGVQGKSRDTECTYVRHLFIHFADKAGVPRSAIARLLNMTTEGVRLAVARFNPDLSPIYRNYFNKIAIIDQQLRNSLQRNVK